MSAQPNEQPPFRPEDEVFKAQEALRNANIRWGQEIGIYEAEIHDINSARARAIVEQADSAGKKLADLLSRLPRPEVQVPVSSSGIMRALGKIIGR